MASRRRAPWFVVAGLPFVIAAAVVVILAVIEVAGLAIGLVPSGFLDHMLPDFDADHDFVGNALGENTRALPGNMYVPVDLLKPILAELQ